MTIIKGQISEKLIKKAHFSESHRILINASSYEVWDAIHKTKVYGSWFIRFVVWLRMLPVKKNLRNSSNYTIFDLDGMPNFLRLGEIPPSEICLGMIGRFWKINGGLIKVQRDQFANCNERHINKLLWSFYIIGKKNSESILSTETQIWCSSFYSWFRFLPYWLIIRLFSGLIRKEILKDISKNCN